MFKKTFYTVLAIGAMVIIGSITSGFISATAETETSAEAPVAGGKWICGKVTHGGSTIMQGTGDWVVYREGTGQFRIVAESGEFKFWEIFKDGGHNADRLTTYLNRHGDISITTGATTSFSFIAYVE